MSEGNVTELETKEKPLVSLENINAKLRRRWVYVVHRWRRYVLIKKKRRKLERAQLYTSSTADGKVELSAKEKRQEDVAALAATIRKQRDGLLLDIPTMYAEPTCVLSDFKACLFGEQQTIGAHHLFEGLTIAGRTYVLFQDVSLQTQSIVSGVAFLGYEDKRVKVRGQDSYNDFKQLFVGVTRLITRTKAVSTRKMPPTTLPATDYQRSVSATMKEHIRREAKDFLRSITPASPKPPKPPKTPKTPKAAKATKSPSSVSLASGDTCVKSERVAIGTPKKKVLSDYIVFNSQIHSFLHCETFADRSKLVSKVHFLCCFNFYETL